MSEDDVSLQDLKKYLWTVLELEQREVTLANDEKRARSSRDSDGEALVLAKRELTQANTARVPEKSDFRPVKPKKPKMEEGQDEAKAGSIINMVVGVAGLGFGVYCLVSGAGIFALLGFFLGGVFLVSALSNRDKASKNDENYKLSVESYKKKLAKYERDKVDAEHKYEDACLERDKRISSAKAAVRKAEQDENVRKGALDTAIKEIAETSESTHLAKCECYDLGILHEKYRNPLAVGRIYGYLDTGRAVTLTGPDGAYNLYEAEIRQDAIIAKLDTIESQLEQIQRTQVGMYIELERANEATERIASSVEELCAGVNRIKALSEISTACAIATKKNTEALKYIELLS